MYVCIANIPQEEADLSWVTRYFQEQVTMQLRFHAVRVNSF